MAKRPRKLAQAEVIDVSGPSRVEVGLVTHEFDDEALDKLFERGLDWDWQVAANLPAPYTHVVRLSAPASFRNVYALAVPGPEG